MGVLCKRKSLAQDVFFRIMKVRSMIENVLRAGSFVLHKKAI